MIFWGEGGGGCLHRDCNSIALLLIYPKKIFNYVNYYYTSIIPSNKVLKILEDIGNVKIRPCKVIGEF